MAVIEAAPHKMKIAVVTEAKCQDRRRQVGAEKVPKPLGGRNQGRESARAIDIGNRCRLVDIDKNPAEIEHEHADRHIDVIDARYEHYDNYCLEYERYQQRARQPESIAE